MLALRAGRYDYSCLAGAVDCLSKSQIDVPWQASGVHIGQAPYITRRTSNFGQDVLEGILCSSWRSGRSACHDAFCRYI